MNINRIGFYGYSSTFRGITPKKDNNKLTREETLKIVIPAGNKLFIDMAKKEVPEKGRFVPVSLSYDLPDTSNTLKMTLKQAAEDPENKRTFILGVHHRDRDRLISNFMATGTRQEIFDYMNSEKNFPEMIETVIKLSDKTDEYYNSL